MHPGRFVALRRQRLSKTLENPAAFRRVTLRPLRVSGILPFVVSLSNREALAEYAV